MPLNRSVTIVKGDRLAIGEALIARTDSGILGDSGDSKIEGETMSDTGDL